MLRIAEHFARKSVLHDLAIFHHSNEVADLRRNAKVMRRVIRSAYLGEAPGDLSSLENPQAVEEIRGTRTKDPESTTKDQGLNRPRTKD